METDRPPAAPRATRPARSAALALAALFAATGADASDGRTEISQADALAGDVTPGDEPGFPVRLTRAGSYVLTGDLVVEPGAAGLVVEADRVSIDLNGFRILGSVTCEDDGGGLVCVGPVGAAAVAAASDPVPSLLVVRNGFVQGFFRGIESSGPAIVVDVVARWNGFRGIDVGPGSLVADCVADENGTGIEAAAGAVLSGNVTSRNADGGLVAAAGSVVVGNVVRETGGQDGGTGATAGAGSAILRNTVLNNGTGISTQHSAVRENSVRLNEEGIWANGSLVADNAVGESDDFGVRTLGTGLVTGNSVSECGGDGIETAFGAVQRNTVTESGENGLQLDRSAYFGNTVTGSASPEVDGFQALDAGANVCGGTPGCP